MKFRSVLLLCMVVLGAFSFQSCKKEYTPKPRGFFRITFPEKQYHLFSENAPYSFDVPNYMNVESSNEKYWYTLDSKEHNAEIHLSYKKVENNLPLYLEDSRRMVYKHAIKATSIDEQMFRNKKQNVFGVIYRLEGNTASPLQFVVTDSVKNFLRGALYFREIPNADSIQPSIDFFSKDVMRLIESTKWKEHGAS